MDELRPLVNKLLDEIRQREGLTSDQALGCYLGTTGQAIYRWRKGQLDNIAKLLPYAAGHPDVHLHTGEIAA